MRPAIKPTPDEKAYLIAKEYEHFAYIVSHDLKAPLRHVRQFTELLIESKKNNLNDEEKEYVEYLEKSLSRIDKMQEALLEFSRLNTRAGPHKEIDCAQLVVQVIEAIPDSKSAKIDCDNLPKLVGEPAQMELLFMRLIENALKYHEDSNRPKTVSIAAKNIGNHWRFEIKDNGIGIDEKYHDDIFNLFRRLAPHKYEGVGAGLTIARKIVESHGGDIHVESEPGQGANFIFTIQKSTGAP